MKEYGAILDYLSNVLVVRIEHGKKNLLQLADTTLALVRCLLAISEQPLDQALLLLRHVVYNRSVLNEEELPRLLKALCTLREHLPFNDPKHSVWKNEALAKVANNIANALKVCSLIYHQFTFSGKKNAKCHKTHIIVSTYKTDSSYIICLDGLKLSLLRVFELTSPFPGCNNL